MISDFQLALIVVAVLVIAGIVVFNYLQEKRYRDRAERAFKTDHPDVLFDGAAAARPVRLEPSLGTLPLPADDVVIDDPEQTYALAPRSGSAGIHTAIDSVALLLAPAPIALNALKPFMDRAKAIARPIRWEAHVAGMWEPVLGGLQSEGVKELRVGLQLANRRGVTHREKIEQFLLLIGDVAAAVGAVQQSEALEAAVVRAAALDAFCADTDIEIAINVIGRNGVTFATTKVRGLAEAAGLTLMDNGEYSVQDEAGDLLFTLRNMNPDESPGIAQAGTYLTGLTFALDVPRVDHGDLIIDQMFAMATQFAVSLSGELVDDNRKPLGEPSVAAIKKAIIGIAQQMIGFGINPGSSVARRLYS